MPIKSFQGQQEQRVKSKAKTLLVGDIMARNLIVFKPNETIHEVMSKFINYRLSGGPVDDENGDLIGVIPDSDCMIAVAAAGFGKSIVKVPAVAVLSPPKFNTHTALSLLSVL